MSRSDTFSPQEVWPAQSQPINTWHFNLYIRCAWSAQLFFDSLSLLALASNVERYFYRMSFTTNGYLGTKQLLSYMIHVKLQIHYTPL